MISLNRYSFVIRVFVFDIDWLSSPLPFFLLMQATLDKAKSWVKELQRQANTDIVIALVGNKLDLCDEEAEESSDNERQVPKEDAQAYADEAGLLFFETSAKSSKNVDSVFTAIAKKIPLESTYAPGSGRNAVGGRNNLDGVNLMQQPSTGSSGACAC